MVSKPILLSDSFGKKKEQIRYKKGSKIKLTKNSKFVNIKKVSPSDANTPVNLDESYDSSVQRRKTEKEIEEEQQRQKFINRMQNEIKKKHKHYFSKNMKFESGINIV